MSQFSNFLENFYAFEMKHDLFKKKIRNVAFWDYIRVFVFQEIIVLKNLNPDLTFPKPALRQNRLTLLASKAAQVGSYLKKKWKDKSVKQTSYDLVFFDIDKRRFMDGVWADPITYPLVKHLGKKYSILVLDPADWSNSVLGSYPCPVISIRLNYLYARLRGLFFRLSGEEKSLIGQLEAAITSEFQLSINITRHLKENFFYQLHFARQLTSILKKVKPKLVFFQNNSKRYFIKAAKDAGIDCVELQHGASSFLDIHTSYPANLEPLETFPKALLTFGDYWNGHFCSPVKKISVGFPFFESKISELDKVKTSRNPKSLIGISVLDPALLDCLFEFSKRQPDFTVYYKLRPDEYATWRDSIPREMQSQPNLVFIDNDKKSLFEYLLESEYVISSCSTAIYEGLHLGTKALIFKGWFHEMADELVESGLALSVANCRELQGIVTKNAAPARKPDSDFFYKPDSLLHYSREVGELLAMNS